MIRPIIKVSGVSKLYRLGSIGATSFRDEAERLWHRLTGRGEKRDRKEFWALRDISFDVREGEVLGIIGRNGAGKSTLLKVLSRITEPTSGEIRVRGRVASLLEVGTGFHPELSGRENIYLNGAILGMTKAEIRSKFDEIVSFAGVEKFLDTPVKRYSSGMYVRLAFAVAAHLESEILLIDEVLAVGDAAFQKKCLGKMGDVTRQGRTVLFVSHNMVAMQSLCQRAVWLDGGGIVEEGRTAAVVTNYLRASSAGEALREEVWEDISTAPGNDLVRLYRVRVRPQDGEPSDPITRESSFHVEIEYWVMEPGKQLHVTLHVYTEQEIIAFTTGSGSESVCGEGPVPAGLFRAVCHVPGKLLNVGRHRFNILVVQDKSSVIHQHESAVSFDVLDLAERQHSWYGKEPGVLQPVLPWTTEHLCGVELMRAIPEGRS